MIRRKKPDQVENLKKALDEKKKRDAADEVKQARLRKEQRERNRKR